MRLYKTIPYLQVFFLLKLVYQKVLIRFLKNVYYNNFLSMTYHIKKEIIKVNW